MKIVGIDIGGTHLRIGLGDEKGKLYKVFKAKTDPRDVMTQIYGFIEQFPEFEGIGIAVGGPISMKDGIIVNPPNMEIKNLNIVKLLEKRYGKKTCLLNDCVAGVIAEKFFGAAKNYSNIVYLTMSTGIGAGVIANGKLVLGKDGNAHEVGHFLAEVDSNQRCGCGSLGHWEAFCGGKSLPNYVKYLVNGEYKDRKSTLIDKIWDLTAEDVFVAAKNDKVAAEITARIGRINAIMLANIVNAYDPEIITIGGSIMLNNQDLLLGSIRKYTKDYVINRMPEIKATHLGQDTPLLGAIAGFLYTEDADSKTKNG